MDDRGVTTSRRHPDTWCYIDNDPRWVDVFLSCFVIAVCSLSLLHLTRDLLIHSLTVNHVFDFLNTTSRVVFVYKDSQDPSVPDPLGKEMVLLSRWLHRLLIEHDPDDHVLLGTARVRSTYHDLWCETLLIRCVFSTHPSPIYLPRQTRSSLWTLSLRHSISSKLFPLTIVTVLVVSVTTPVPACLWCDKKGHTLIDCTGPEPNSVSKLARDEELVVRVALESRNDNRQTSRPTMEQISYTSRYTRSRKQRSFCATSKVH